ncbi:MAG: response regulator [Nitrospirae bacterium]|nr:response regulator [Nitrospirota bacterium]
MVLKFALFPKTIKKHSNSLIYICTVVFFSIIIFAPLHAYALEPIVLTDKQERYQLGQSIEYLEDKDKKWTIEDVSSEDMSRQFKKITTQNPSFGYTKSAYWLRFKLKNNTMKTKDWLIESSYLIESINLYIKKSNGFIMKRSGISIPYSEREFKNRTYVFPIEVNSNSENIYYVRLQTRSSMVFDAEVMTQSAFLTKTNNETLFYGIYFGFIIVMIIYNSFIYFSVKDKAYLYYILHLFFWGFHMFAILGYGIIYFYDNFAVFNQALYLNVFSSISFMTLFAKEFLKTNIYAKGLDIVINIMIILFFLVTTLTYIDVYNMRFEVLFLLLIPLVVFSASIISYKNGNKSARFFIIGWGFYLSSIIIFLSKIIGIIPFNFITNNIHIIGSALEMTLLSLALADRINIMKNELIESAEFKLKAETEIAKTQKLESIALLAGGMAHDLNNILAGLFMKVQLSERTITKDTFKAASYLSDVKTIFNMAKNILNRLQTFSRGDALFIRQQSLTKLLSEVGNLVLSGSNSQCEVTILKDLWAVEFDKTQLNQVITNLLINADQAMPNGGKINIVAENIEIIDTKIQYLINGKYIKITIRDNGKGIPKENIHKIFDPFFTTKESGQGLGLAMSYSIVKKHKGHIEVESELGKGTSFYIYLPASESEQIEEEQELIPDQWQLLGKSILIMDDNETLLESITAILSEKGCIVDVARNGDEAIALYTKGLKSTEPYDILIIDVTISGGMGGITAIKKLKEMDPKVKAIVSSGYSEIPVMSNFRQYGFVAALPKPYTIEELNYVLQESLEYK